MVRIREGKRSISWGALAVYAFSCLFIFTVSSYFASWAITAVLDRAHHKTLGESLWFGLWLSAVTVAWSARREWKTSLQTCSAGTGHA
jgi:hypothetical protein